MMKLILFAVASTVFMAPAVAAQTAAPTAPPTTPAPPAKAIDRIVCRTEDTLGSRINKQKICMTVSQWRDVSRQSGDWLEHRTQTGSKPGGG